MNENQLEKRLKENAETLFGQVRELPDGHRERFEQRLQSRMAGKEEAHDTFGDVATAGKQRKIVSWKMWLSTSVAAAAVIAGVVFLMNPFAKDGHGAELAEVRNYYAILLEEQADATRQMIQQVDETHRKILLANVELIENEPLPDVQMPDDEYIILIAGFYSKKIETLQNIQDILSATESQENI